MRITVLPHKRIPSPESDDFEQRDADAEPCDFDDAFAKHWPTDAHFTAYEPVTPPELNGAAVRLASGALGEVPVRMVALVGDLDDPDAHREKRPTTAEWRASVLPKLQASGLAAYATRGGFRVLAVLKEPIDLRSAEDARLWRSTYLGWCAEQKTKHGLHLDTACADWTRLFRLPNVVREGVGPVRAKVIGELPTIDLYAIPAAPVSNTTTATATIGADDRELTDRERSELDAAAAILGDSFTHGQRHLMALAIGGWLRSVGLPPGAAEYLISQLPSDATDKRIADAVKAWSKAGPVEGWAALKRMMPADALAQLSAIKVGPSAKKDLLERMAERNERKPAANDATDLEDPYPILGRVRDLKTPPKPMAYLIEGLPFAPGGKVNAVAGPPAGSKTPWALWLMICVATGQAFLGRRVLRAGACLYLDAETGDIAHRRLERMCRPLGFELGDLPIEFRDVEVTFSEAFCVALEAHLTATPRALVVIDTYGAMLGADVDYNTPEFALWLRALGRLSRALLVTIVVLIHEKKTNDGKVKGSGLEMISGSFSAAGAMQAVISLRPTGEGNEAPITVSCSRAPEDKFDPFQIRWVDVADPNPAGKYSAASRDARLWGLRPVVVEAGAAPVNGGAVDAKALAYGQRVVELLGKVQSANQTHLTQKVAGPKRATKLEVLQALVDEGVLHRADFGEAGDKGGAKVHSDYSLRPRAPGNADAYLRWSK